MRSSDRLRKGLRMKLEVAIECSNCEQEVEVMAKYEAFTNSIEYVCTQCNQAGSEGNWKEGTN
jgi:DNA-directed RNA polymerase subunit RPC12/RpoP